MACISQDAGYMGISTCQNPPLAHLTWMPFSEVNCTKIKSILKSTDWLRDILRKFSIWQTFCFKLKSSLISSEVKNVQGEKMGTQESMSMLF